MNAQPDRRARYAGTALAALLGILLVAGPSAAAQDACTTAMIDEPFRLPTGSLHAPGRLTLCERGGYSPVASFHEMRVDGAAVALAISRHESNESASTEAPFLMFLRGADGRLVLLGYAYPAGDGMRSFAFGAAAERNQVLARPSAGEPLILVAAAIN